jgi:mannose-1-phosphate guanylyltransferase
MGDNQSRWGIVLAAGEGNRVRDFLAALCGGRGIKQFCTVLGRRSLLEMTLDRVQQLIPRERILIIVDKRHRPEANQQLADWPQQNIIYQPANKETGPGILLPLAHVSHRDPNATVAVFPSDHFVCDELGFASHVASAFAETEQFPQSTILLGVTPDRLEEGYGWISCERESRKGKSSWPVHTFREKPSMQEAEQLMSSGALWNTFVFAARAATLWEMARRTVPDLYGIFCGIRIMIGSHQGAGFIEKAYERMPTVNFSHAVLTPCTDRLRVLPVPGIGWSDWGSADRILDSALRLGQLEELATRLKNRRIEDPSITNLLSRYESTRASRRSFENAAA